MDCFIFNNESINKIKDAVIIEGPDAVLNSSEENNPIITDNRPPIIENITIFCGFYLFQPTYLKLYKLVVVLLILFSEH